ncbi:hypothetical protein ACFXG6_19125 [Streptomyces roseus]|uniref:hypothetical protein n=1 Tax=Streptomyces roseus TaxID=66430 RepID=UPI003689DF0B
MRWTTRAEIPVPLIGAILASADSAPAGHGQLTCRKETSARSLSSVASRLPTATARPPQGAGRNTMKGKRTWDSPLGIEYL